MSGFAPRFTITHAITAGLMAVERARGFLEAAELSEEWVRRMSQRALLLEAHHTTHIEGSQLTIEQSERLWAGQPVVETQAGDVRELLNYREAVNLVSDYLESGEPVTEGLIREIQRRLVAGEDPGQTPWSGLTSPLEAARSATGCKTRPRPRWNPATRYLLSAGQAPGVFCGLWARLSVLGSKRHWQTATHPLR